MIIAQMTDIHIGFDPDAKPEELNRIRFRAVLDRLANGPNRPDLLVLSGDITDHGDGESFARTAALLADVPFQVWPMVGNHDSRAGLISAFPQVRAAEGGFVHYVLEHDGLRIICLDTLEDGRHAGAFCAARAAWLAAKLDEAPAVPAMIFMHHPPVVSGIGWMDPAPDEGWIMRLAAVLRPRAAQVRAIHCGHLHRVVTTQFCGIPLSVTPSVAPLVALDLNPVDPDAPDNRELISTEPPGYALHRWDGADLATHYETVGDWRILARFTEHLQPMIREMVAERGAG